MNNNNKFGFIRVASAIPEVYVGNPEKNADEIIKMLDEALSKGVQCIVFPELCMTGYTCEDIIMNHHLVSESEKQIKRINEWFMENHYDKDNMVYILGAPVVCHNTLFNCAVVCINGQVEGIVPKTYLPNYNEFRDQRWYSTADILNKTVNNTITYAGQRAAVDASQIFEIDDICNKFSFKFAVEVCEDMFAPIPPSSKLALSGAEIIFNLSASNELIGKHEYLVSLIKQQSARTISAYVYSGAGWGESSTDVLYAGNAIICENGKIIRKSERFKKEPQMMIADVDIEAIRNERIENKTFAQNIHSIDLNDYFAETTTWNRLQNPVDDNLFRELSQTPFVPKSKKGLSDRCEEIINIETLALARRIKHVNPKKLVLGVSGGSDSTMTLLLACSACKYLGLPISTVCGITMPYGGNTTSRTKDNAIKLMEALGVESKTIDITDAVKQHFSDIGQSEDDYSICYENCQARERTQVLLDYANKVGGFVLCSSDLSEGANGYCTHGADNFGSYNTNCGLSKMLIKHLIRYYADEKCVEFSFIANKWRDIAGILYDILDTPISPELKPSENDEIAQKTEENVTPYVLADFFLYYLVRYNFSLSKILYLAIKAFDWNAEPYVKNQYYYSTDDLYKYLKLFFKRFVNAQYKRNSAAIDGVKVGSVSLSSRGDWRMPSDMRPDSFIKELDDYYNSIKKED